MKRLYSILTSLALLAGGLAPSAFADKGGNKGRQEKHGKHEEKSHHASESNRARYEKHPKHSPKESHDWERNRGWNRNGGWHGHKDWHGARSHHWHQDHRTWGQRGGYRGHYVPWVTFNLYFGNHNSFRIASRPAMYDGYPRFHHHNQTFMIVDPWPDDWDEDWYESDDVYIDYDEGYYLHNRRHSGYALSIVVVE